MARIPETNVWRWGKIQGEWLISKRVEMADTHSHIVLNTEVAIVVKASGKESEEVILSHVGPLVDIEDEDYGLMFARIRPNRR